jgi:putative ABC transport system permease protein
MFPTPLTRLHGQDSRTMFYLLQIAVTFVLLIACANIANILLARGTRRAHEMAVRSALGATRKRLLQQMLTESMLLSLSGGLLGALFALWGIRLARAIGGFPGVIEPTLNIAVLAFTALISMTTGVVCGIVPAIRASNVSPGDTLRAEGGRAGAGGAGTGRLRKSAVAIQIASTSVLATGALLMLQTLANRQRIDLGFNPHGAVLSELTFTGARYADPSIVRNTAISVIDAIEADSEVAVAGGSGWTLSRGVGAELNLAFPGRVDAVTVAGMPRAVEAVTAGYFAAMGMNIKQGRAFTDHDRAGAGPVAIVNDQFALHVWPGRSPLGETIRIGAASDAAPIVTVVGVVNDTRRSGMHSSVSSRLYVPYAQFPSTTLTLVARARSSLSTTTSAMNAAVRRIDRDLVLDDVRTLEEDVAQFLAPVRLLTILYGAFGSTALLLAAFGVFSTMSYTMSQRRREMAVRAALGADRADVIRLVLKDGLGITAIGLAPGLIGAVAAGEALTRVSTVRIALASNFPLLSPFVSGMHRWTIHERSAHSAGGCPLSAHLAVQFGRASRQLRRRQSVASVDGGWSAVPATGSRTRHRRFRPAERRAGRGTQGE